MNGVEENETDRRETQKTQKTTQKVFRLSVLIAVIALVAAGTMLMNVTYISTYHFGSSGSLDDARIVPPNGTIMSFDSFNVRSFRENTLTARYTTYFQIDVAYANVSLQIQLVERINPEGSFPVEASGNFVQPPTLIYNEAWNGPLKPEDGTTLSYSIRFPLKSPKEKGLLDANSFAIYNTTVTNLGKETVVYNSSGNGTNVVEPNNTGSLSLKTMYPVIEETNYPYFYVGVALLIVAIVLLSCHLYLCW